MKIILFLIGSFAIAQQTTQPIIALQGTVTDCNDATPIALQQGAFMASVPLSGYIFPLPSSAPVDCPGQVPTGQAQYTPVTVTGADVNKSGSIAANALLTPFCGSQGKASGYATLCLYQNNAIVVRAIYRYDTTPNVISLENIAAGNERVRFTIKDDKNLQDDPGYQVCYTQADTGDGLKASQDCSGFSKNDFKKTKDISISGLTNDKPYFFKAKVNTPSSQWTDPVGPVVPVKSYGIGGVYDGEGNPVSFSCAQTSNAPATWVLLLSLLGALRFFRSRKAVLLVLGFLFSTLALADAGQINFGIIGTPYRPNLDGSTKGDGSKISPFYKCMYDNKLSPLMGIEVDVHLNDDFGSLQLGMGADYAYFGGKALKEVNGKPDCSSQAIDSVAMHTLHLRPQLTYVMDTWVDDFPLVPYVRVGLVAVGYMMRYQDGLDKENGFKPLGVVFGWQAAAGLMLSMAFMEPSVAKAARANGVYRHVYLKAEAAYMPINNFYSKGLNFSPAWPTEDFPLMLNFGLVFEFN
ncbi:MAG: hypothetical protein V4534_05325 [Myxococcota bacterium]